MSIDYGVLSAEINNDPLDRGYASMNNNEVWASLLVENRPLRILVPLWQIKKHAIENGYWLTLKNTTAEHAGYAAAALAVDYIDDARFDNLDIDLASTQLLLGGLVATSLLTQTLADELSALANSFQSRANELGLIGLSNGHISEVRA
jgi:hypothetical protein